jgi:hypothetical protein
MVKFGVPFEERTEFLTRLDFKGLIKKCTLITSVPKKRRDNNNSVYLNSMSIYLST